VDLDRNEMLRVGVRKGFHQHVLNDAEDGGGGAYPERQGYHGNDGKAWTFPKVSSGVVEILPK
jgi:hypothetical protein